MVRESARAEERFQHVLVLKAAHSLLQLKLLVDADFPYPALVVFPSWEKLLEEDNERTQIGIQQLLVDVVAWATGEDLCSFEEVLEYLDIALSRMGEAQRQREVCLPRDAVNTSL